MNMKGKGKRAGKKNDLLPASPTEIPPQRRPAQRILVLVPLEILFAYNLDLLILDDEIRCSSYSEKALVLIQFNINKSPPLPI